GPLAIVAVEFKAPRDAGRDDSGQLIELRLGRRVNAGVGDCGPDPKLHARYALTGGEEIAVRRAPIILHQPILETNPGVAADQFLDLIEIDDDVSALRHPEANAGDLQGSGNQVAVIPDKPEWDLCVRTQRIGEEQLVEARRPGVQQPKAISPLIDIQE